MQNTKSILVSVIVITYNSSKYVIETLESIKNQTYKNIELIISDDSSVDNTIELCKIWLEVNAQRFSISSIITSKINTGVSANVNRGVFNSKGEWFKLVAGDDLLTTDCIYENINYIEQNIDQPISILSSNIEYFRVIEGKYIGFDVSKDSILNLPNITAEQQYQLFLRGFGRRINSLFIKNDVFVKCGGCDETFRLKEDGPLIGKMLKNNYKIYFLNKVLFKYRIHSESITGLKQKYIISAFDYNDKIMYPLIYLSPNLPFLESKIILSKVSINKFFLNINIFNRNKLINRIIYNSLLFVPNKIQKVFKEKCIAKYDAMLHKS